MFNEVTRRVRPNSLLALAQDAEDRGKPLTQDPHTTAPVAEELLEELTESEKNLLRLTRQLRGTPLYFKRFITMVEQLPKHREGNRVYYKVDAAGLSELVSMLKIMLG